MDNIITEIIKCKEDFAYFAKTYAKVLHPEKGLINFELYPFQENKVLPAFEHERFVVLRKFRQAGLSTLASMYCLWKVLFFVDQRVLMISISDRDSKNLMAMIKRTWENLPDWMRCETVEYSQHVLKLETESEIRCGTPKMGRGYSANIIIVDEAAFIPKMEEVWKGIFPAVSAAGSSCKVFVISTVNGMGNWYADVYHKAKLGQNAFKYIDLNYQEHPEYNKPEYVESMKNQLGPRGWDQEVLGIFLSSSDTFIRPERIKELSETIEANPLNPKKLYNEKLWIYAKPKTVHRSYILCADVAEGLGGDHDSSAFHVIDMVTLEQVCEFLDNTISTYQYAKIINEIGKYYNNAMVVIENNALGVAVLEKLYHDLDYDNIYWSRVSKKQTKMGFTMTSKNRPLVLNLLSNLIENRHVKIKSTRLFNEIQTFEYNVAAGRAEARRGKHDDLIMSLAIGLFTRNTIINETPIGAINIDINDEEFEPTFDMSHVSVLSSKAVDNDEDEYGDISEEKMSDRISDESSLYNIDTIDVIRQDDDEESLLREFGW